MAAESAVAVSFVIPVLNEARHVRAAIDSVLAQQGLAEREIILVLGRSSDGTDEIVDSLARVNDEIVVIRNPTNAISRSMNLGLAAARFDVLVRVDAHSVLDPQYAASAVRSLRSVGAANLGGRMRAVGTTPFESAVAWAYNSPVGLGGAVYHVGREAGPAESAYLGVFDRAELAAIGGFDETLSRGEDWELNFRFREAGKLVWFDPELEVEYRPRSTLRALGKQFYASGRWRGELIRRLGQGIPFRYFLPPLLVVSIAVGILVTLVSLAVWTVAPLAWIPALLGLSPIGLYLVLVLAIAATASVPIAVRARLCVVLPSMHVWWGWGCLLGLFVRSRGHNSLAGR